MNSLYDPEIRFWLLICYTSTVFLSFDAGVKGIIAQPAFFSMHDRNKEKNPERFPEESKIMDWLRRAVASNSPPDCCIQMVQICPVFPKKNWVKT